MQIVDDEQDRFVERAGPGDDPIHDSVAVEARRRADVLDRAPAARRTPQRVDGGKPEPLGVALVAVHRHPGGPLAEARRLDPRSKEDRLACTGGRRDERDSAGVSGPQPLEEGRPCDDRGPTNGGPLGGSHEHIVACGGHQRTITDAHACR